MGPGHTRIFLCEKAKAVVLLHKNVPKLALRKAWEIRRPLIAVEAPESVEKDNVQVNLRGKIWHQADGDDDEEDIPAATRQGTPCRFRS